MRPIRLARVAAEAEGVRLRALMTRTVTRVIFALLGLIFTLGALVFAHVAAWYELRVGLSQAYLATTAIMGGSDLLLAIILLLLASRSSPSRAEVEAREVRRRAIEGIGSALALTQMALPLLRLISGMLRRTRT